MFYKCFTMYHNVLQVFHDVLQCLVSRAIIGIADHAATDRLRDHNNAQGISNNAAGIGNNSTEIVDNTAGISNIATNVIPC